MFIQTSTEKPSSIRYYSRKQASPIKSAEAKYTSDIICDYMNELEPGAVFKFHFLWSCNKRDEPPLSPTSTISSSSDHSSDNSSDKHSDSSFKMSRSHSSSALSCNVRSFPFLLGQIIDYERQKRSTLVHDRLNSENNIKQAAGAIILASKRLQSVVKDSEAKKPRKKAFTNFTPTLTCLVESTNDQLAHKELKSPLVCHISLGISSAYPDTDLEFWRSNLQRQMRLKHNNDYRVFKKVNKQSTMTPPKLRARSSTSKAKNLQRLPITPNSTSDTKESMPTPERRCVSCGCSSTPCWRPSWYGNSGLLCNSCGLRYKKIGVRCLNKNCRHIPLRSEFREMKSKMNGSSTIDCIKCGGEVKIRG